MANAEMTNGKRDKFMFIVETYDLTKIYGNGEEVRALDGLLLFGTISLLLSMLLPSRRLAATTAGLLLVASFFITGLAKINEDLEPIAKLSPFNYYQTQEAFQGLNGTWLAGLLAAAMLFAALAW